MQKFVASARRLALSHEYDDALMHRLCAVVVQGGSVVSVGFNKRATNSFVEECLKHGGEHIEEHRKTFVNTHAEADAILKAHTLYAHRDPELRKTALAGAKVFVARLGKDDAFAMSRPCMMCENMLFRYGIRKAFYSIDDGSYGIMTIDESGITEDEVVSCGM